MKSKTKNENLDTKMTNYPVGDFLIRLKNTALAGRKTMEVKNTKLISAVSKALMGMGYLSDVKISEGVLSATLVYKDKMPLLSDIILVSKPSRRVYMGAEEIQHFRSPYQMILTTTSGIMSSQTAVKKNLGGEILAKIL